MRTPTTYTLQVIPGLEEALASMQPGGERQILVRCISVVLVLMSDVSFRPIPSFIRT